MRKFEKSSKLDNVCYDIRGPVMDEANRMVAEGVNVLKLNIGNPAPHGLMAPDEVVRDMAYNLRDTEDIQIQRDFSLQERQSCSTAS